MHVFSVRRWFDGKPESSGGDGMHFRILTTTVENRMNDGRNKQEKMPSLR